MATPQVISISATASLGAAPHRRILDVLHTVVLAAALLLLCATAARGESAWNKLFRAVAGKGDAQTASAQAPSLLPQAGQLPAIPDDQNYGTTGTAAVVPQAMTGLAMEGNSGGDNGGLDLGRESDEQSMMATDLFQKPEMLRLLGDNPRFIYNPAERPDPMLVPWVRNAAIFAELDAAANEALKANDVDAAIGYYERVMALNDPRFTMLAQAKLMEINNAKAQTVMAQASLGQVELAKIELPTWVSENTTGIINGGGENMALVGDDMLRAGDPLPKYPEIKVASITPSKVTFQIQSKTFEVELRPAE